MRNHLQEHTGLAVIVALFLVLGLMYSAVTPLFETPDEDFHFAVVRHIATTGALPRVEPGVPTPWGQEGTQPPLYYLLAAGATFWVDTGDYEATVRLNPHAALGEPDAPDNHNRMVHTPAEAFPWRGTTLAVHLVRALGVLMGAGTVALTYFLAREVWPDHRAVALLAAALVAFNPQFLFISGSVNNDTLTALLGTLTLLLAARVVGTGLTQGRSAALAVCVALLTATKLSGLAFVPLALAALALYGWRFREWRGALRATGEIVLAWSLLAGWWYTRNVRLYGDPTGLNAHLDLMVRRSITLLDLRHELAGLWQSYWSMFGWFNLPVEPAVYAVYTVLAVLAAAGLVWWLVSRVRTRDWGALLLPGMLAAQVGVLLASLARWSLMTLGSQGRLLFPVIAAIASLLAFGLLGVLPTGWRTRGLAAVGAPLLVLAAVAPWRTIAPAYRPPEYRPGSDTTAAVDFTPPGADAPALRLLGFEVQDDTVYPGESVVVTAHWEALAPTPGDWSVFVHLTDSAELIAGQYDSYPGGGLLATSTLAPGTRWTDVYYLTVNPTAYSPETLEVRIGLYDIHSGARMVASNGQDRVQGGRLRLAARENGEGIPNPVTFNFDGEMALLGYALDTRTARPGDTLTLDLYWQGLRALARDYTVSVQFLAETDARNIGQKDSWPVEGAQPTTTWTPGEVVHDTVRVTLAEDAPLGVYNVQVVVYWFNEAGELQRLGLRGPRGEPLPEDAVLLTKFRVNP